MTFHSILSDVGLLTAASSVAILVISEVISPHYGRVNATIDVKKLRLAAMGFIIVFIAIAVITLGLGSGV